MESFDLMSHVFQRSRASSNLSLSLTQRMSFNYGGKYFAWHYVIVCNEFFNFLK